MILPRGVIWFYIFRRICVWVFYLHLVSQVRLLNRKFLKLNVGYWFWYFFITTTNTINIFRGLAIRFITKKITAAEKSVISIYWFKLQKIMWNISNMFHAHCKMNISWTPFKNQFWSYVVPWLSSYFILSANFRKIIIQSYWQVN